MEAMLKATEVAQLMGCSKEYVTRMAREGRLEHEKTLQRAKPAYAPFPGQRSGASVTAEILRAAEGQSARGQASGRGRAEVQDAKGI